MASTIRYGAGVVDRRIDIYRRAFDLIVSVSILVVVLPVLVVAVLGSAVSLRAWPFFTQYRVGRDGELFRFLKVRTLRPDVPGYTDKHQLDVSRIPPFCRLLRRLHLDELPQLLLVLTGKMSLVGPRPEMAYLHDRMPADFAALRTSVRPGCTGLWQISDACTDLIGAAPQYDCYYLASRTLRLDLWLLFRTSLSMLGIGRCVTLDAIPGWTRRAEQTVDLDLTDPALGESVALPATAAR